MDTPIISVVGLCFVLQLPRTNWLGRVTRYFWQYRSLWRQTKQSAIDYAHAHMVNHDDGEPFWQIIMPCEHVLAFGRPEDILNLPIKDIPCSCGDPTHWFVKFEIREA